MELQKGHNPTTESKVINIGDDRNRKHLMNSDFGFHHAGSGKYLHLQDLGVFMCHYLDSQV